MADRRDVGRADGDEATLVGVAFHRDDAAAHRQIVLDQDEAAGGGIGLVLVEGEQALGAEHHLAGTIALDPVGGLGREVARVDDVLDRRDRDRGLERVELEDVLAAGRQGLVTEPEEARLEDVGLEGGFFLVAHDLAALDEDLLVEGDAEALAGARRLERLRHVPGLDRLDPRRLVRGREDDRIADLQPTGLDPAGDDAALVELVDVLHRHPERPLGRRLLVLEGIERLEDAGALIPGHLGAVADDVVALPGGDRDDAGGLDAEILEIGPVLLGDLAEPVGRVVDEVHLVDQHGHLADAQEVEEIAVAARLLLHALGGVDEQEGRLRGGGPRHHVLEELLVARRIDDDVRALLGLEADLGRVDRDPLVALGLDRVHEEGPLERHAAPLGHGLDRLELALGQGAALVDQPADEGRLAVIDMADDDDLQLVGLLVRAHERGPSQR